MKRDDLLVWVDLEMTGLDPNSDQILEIATVVTDSDLEVVAEGLDLIIHADKNFLNERVEKLKQEGFEMDQKLVEQVLSSNLSIDEAERQTLDFIKEFVAEKSSPLCGNSIHRDRIFLEKYMPSVTNYLHYRNLDVSTVKELARRWQPSVFDEAKKMKQKSHRAKDDILESINELRLYRDYFLKIKKF